MAYRVIVDGNSGDGFRYRIEDMYDFSKHGNYQIVSHGEDVLAARGSLDDLRKKLREMLAACDKPLLAFKTGMVELPNHFPSVLP